MNTFLASCLNGEMDPIVGLARLSDEDLATLADALFRHLDAGKPEFGAQSWYDSVREEIAARAARGTVKADVIALHGTGLHDGGATAGAEPAEATTPEPDLAG